MRDATAHKSSEKYLPFKHLTADEVQRIDEAAAEILDNGFGTLEVKWEYFQLRWITKVVPLRIPPSAA